jgi:hypothetical protein
MVYGEPGGVALTLPTDNPSIGQQYACAGIGQVGDDVYALAVGTSGSAPGLLYRRPAGGSFALDHTFALDETPSTGPFVVGSAILIFAQDASLDLLVYNRASGSWVLEANLTSSLGVSGNVYGGVLVGTSMLWSVQFTGTMLQRTAAGVWSLATSLPNNPSPAAGTVGA